MKLAVPINTFNNSMRLIVHSVAMALLGSMCLPILSCSVPQITHTPPIQFVIINNTSPRSPYEHYPQQLNDVIQRINKENPIFTIHTGNIVHAGTRAMGINRIDVENQYRRFYEYVRHLTGILFTVCGPLDTFNNSTDLYTQFTRASAWYSFNYGNNHFIVLHSHDQHRLRLSDSQMKWLRENLRQYAHSAIIIFSYYLPEISRGGMQFTDSEHQKLHDLLRRYNVIAFFGSAGSNGLPLTIDTIQYIPVPCDNRFNNRNTKAVRYYVVDFDGTQLTVVPRYF